jgi:hypothetical protein
MTRWHMSRETDAFWTLVTTEPTSKKVARDSLFFICSFLWPLPVSYDKGHHTVYSPRLTRRMLGSVATVVSEPEDSTSGFEVTTLWDVAIHLSTSRLILSRYILMWDSNFFTPLQFCKPTLLPFLSYMSSTRTLSWNSTEWPVEVTNYVMP